MFLTECWIPEQKIKNPYELHQAIWSLFPNTEKREFLFSVLERQYGRGGKIILQSLQCPMMQGEDVKVLRSPKNLQDLQLPNGKWLRFRLVANPTKKIRDKDNPERAIRVPYVVLEQQEAWLERKLAGCAHVVMMDVSQMEPIYFRKKEMHGKIQPVLFTGVLAVEDSQRLLDVMKTGVGAGKAFGLGLLQVAAI